MAKSGYTSLNQEILKKLTTMENLLKGQTETPLTLDEAAQYLDISKSYIYKLTCSNKIPHYKPQGKRLYFAKSELDTWLLRNPVKSTADIEQKAISLNM
ncbi:helix-turn-helix domain-containing protein [candidate division KSB1 bacterium]|nr:helix-turn-helix domain-containing protein [candidate division KSB1 bacterium]